MKIAILSCSAATKKKKTTPNRLYPVLNASFFICFNNTNRIGEVFCLKPYRFVVIGVCFAAFRLMLCRYPFALLLLLRL